MKKYLILPIFLSLLVACDVAGLRGNGKLVTNQRSVTTFSNIEAGGAFRIEWRAGAPSCTVTSDENLQPYIEVKNDGKFLRLRTTRSINPRHGIEVVLTSPSLEGAQLSGASWFTAQALKGPKFFLETSGASKVTMDGSVDEFVSSMTGASKLDAANLQTKNAELSVTGAGKARIAVSDTLKVSITGAGKVDYSGNPHSVKRDITGAGSIEQVD